MYIAINEETDQVIPEGTRFKVDGYCVGDRFLEECYFYFKIENGKLVFEQPDNGFEEYLADYHSSFAAWLPDLEDYLEDGYVTDDTGKISAWIGLKEEK